MSTIFAEKIHVIGKIFLDPEHTERLEKLGVRYVADSNPSRSDKAEIRSRIGDATVILVNISTPVTADILAASPNLKFIQTWSTGVDNIDIEYARTHGIRVANVEDFSTEAVAEKTIGLLILSANRLIEANKHALAGGWDYQRFQGTELRGKTLCLIGYGKIAKRVEELARAFGMQILTVNSQTSREDMNRLIEKSHFISVHCPLTANTRHMIGAEQFELMHGAILINNSRGGVVDEEAMLHALNSGNLRFATMDVFEEEPPSQAALLLNHPNVFVTPHCAWNSTESVKNLTDRAIRNIELFVQGKLGSFII